MAPKQLAHFRRLLEGRQCELKALLGKRESLEVDSSSEILDRIQHASERDIAIGNLERESERLREVRSALQRIRQGTFGVCLECEEEISVKRLAALPWTASCLACREAAERNPMLPETSFEESLLAAA